VPKKRILTDRYILKVMNDCTTELPQEVSVKAAEIELIYRAQSGDTEAFGQLVTIRIFNTINVIVGDENDA